MAINDNAVIAPEGGHYYTAVTGTPFPTSMASPDSPWEDVGHTSLEDILSSSSDGGDVTTLGTLQKKILRTKRGTRTETFAINLHQFDTAGLKLFYGSNAETLADGTIGVPVDPVPTTCAFLAIFSDGANMLPFYAPKAEIFRGDDFELSDTESLARLPLSIQPLQYQTNTWLYATKPIGEPTVP